MICSIHDDNKPAAKAENVKVCDSLTDDEIRIKVAEAIGYERRPCEWQNFIA